MIVATDLDIVNLTTGSTTSYNTSSLLLGNLIRKVDDGEYTYVRPSKITPNRIFDYYGVAFQSIQAISYSSDTDYVLGLVNPSSQTTFTANLAKYNKTKEEWTNCGRIFVTALTGSVATRTPSGIDGKLYRYTSGSVQVNGFNVTGSGTNWGTDRIFQGARIGFGTTSSANVTEWYEVSNVPTNTNLTINSRNSLSFPPGTPYIIEELKIAITFYNTNAISPQFGGTLLIQGINEDVFSLPGTTIIPYGGLSGTGSFTDRTRGFVRLAEAQNSIYQGPGPVCFNRNVNTTSSLNDLLYVFNAFSIGSFPAIHLLTFNLGTPITSISTGSSFTQFDRQLVSGSIATGFANTGRSCFFANLKHGPGSGSTDLYLPTAGRLLRMKASDFRSGSLTVGTDVWVEVPPMGPINILPVQSAFTTYIPSIDRFIMAGTPNSFMFKYNTNLEENERRVLTTSNMINTTATKPYPNFIYSTADTVPLITCDNDTLYMAIGSTTTSRFVWINLPVACDYKYAPQSKQWAVFPKLNTPSNKKFKRAFVKFDQDQVAPENLGYPSERVFIYYRTSGISDDTGTWTLLQKGGDMSDIVPSEEIQLAVAWDVLGSFALYPRVYGITLVYENDSQISQYVPSIALTSVPNRAFVWRQAQLFTTPNIPTLRIRLYNSETENLILEDTSTAQSQGTFQYSTDNGVTWNAWNASQNVVGNYIKYTANALPANTLVNAIITEQ